jgi:hypothetical protein
VTLEQAVRLAVSRPVPAARLGFRWLQAKGPFGASECRVLLGLVEAQAEPVRPELVGWLRGVLAGVPEFRADWVMEFLDSRHADVREEGWKWFRVEPRARDDVGIWQKLLESPYDELRVRIVAALEERVGTRGKPVVDADRLDAELVRFLWAAVLLNVHRGGRTKPLAVGQLVSRIARRPGEAAALLPILAVALRSVRGPEWRAGLSGVVQLVGKNPELTPVVRAAFPELKLED